jgi:hypothetical protein
MDLRSVLDAAAGKNHCHSLLHRVLLLFMALNRLIRTLAVSLKAVTRMSLNVH